MPVSEETYLRIVEEDPDTKWELYCGELRSKPTMTWEHDRVTWRLGYRLQQQLDLERFEVRVDSGQVKRSSSQYFVPDVIVIPLDAARETFTRRGMTAVYSFPLPLVVEVWSPSTGGYDATTKLPDYQQRGDHEIWLLHPYERRLSVWQRRPDGTYAQTEYHGGRIQPASLPGVTIDLDDLFRLGQG
jgi:Uma2 family endonuclease